MTDGLWGFTLTAHLGFALYIAGFLRAPPGEIVDLYRPALKQTLLVTASILGLVAVWFLIGGQPDWLTTVPLIGYYVFCYASLAVVFVNVATHFRDHIVAPHSGVEIIFLNLFIWTAGGSNPVAPYLLSPIPVGWLSFPLMGQLDALLGFWPMLLVVLCLWRKVEPGPRLRLFLGAWIIISYVVLLTPSAWQALTTFDASSPGAYLGSMLHVMVTIHVVLLLFWMSVLHSDLGHEMVQGGRAKFLASRVELGGVALPWVLATALADWVALKLLLSWLGDRPLFVAIALAITAFASRELVSRLPAPGSGTAARPPDEEIVPAQVFERLWQKRYLLPLWLIPVGILAWSFPAAQRERFALDLTSHWMLQGLNVICAGLLLAAGLKLLAALATTLKLRPPPVTGPVMLLAQAGLALLILNHTALPGTHAPDREPTAPPPGPVAVTPQTSGASYALDRGVLYLSHGSRSLLGTPRQPVLLYQDQTSRRVVCSTSARLSRELLAFEVLDGERVECRMRQGFYSGREQRPKTRERIRFIDLGNHGRVRQLGGRPTKPAVAEIRDMAAQPGANPEQDCQLAFEPVAAVQCGHRRQELPVAAEPAPWTRERVASAFDQRIWPRPLAWLPGTGVRQAWRHPSLHIACLEAEVRASLPFEAPGRVPAVVLVDLDPEVTTPGGLSVAWLYDENLTCARLEVGASGSAPTVVLSDKSSRRLYRSITEIAFGLQTPEQTASRR